nr:putative reverse transcriptase domain-containing protein [Tanacetum cinerariifolium]
MKVSEPKLEDIPVVRKFPGVFPEDLSGLPPSRKVEFRIDLIPGDMPVVKSPYCLAPTKMQELSNQLKNSKTKSKEEHEVYLKLILELLEKDKLFKKFSKCEFWLQEGDEQKNAFQTLKDMLCDAPILALLEGINDFVVYCDASNQGFGCILMQRNMQSLQKALGMRLDMCTAYHPQTDGQSVHTMKTLDDMHMACEIDFEGNWDTHLPLVEFSYNNSYHSSVKFLLKHCMERSKGLKTAQDRQKSYADNRRKPLKFSVGDKVLLNVSPRKDVVRFGKRSSPRYVGPFEIVERVSPVAYRLGLPQELVGVHDMFHVSNLKKCLANLNLHIPLEEIKIDDKLHFVKEPMEIMDCEVKKLKRRRIPIVKVC